MAKQKKLGFYRKFRQSNKRLIKIFEKNQKARFNGDWKDKKFIKKLVQEEREARKEVLVMLKKGQICTSDDFYRAAFLFHHGNNFRFYALAVALAAASYHLGEPWGRNFYAAALDRFLLSVGQLQYFGTQFEKKYGKWKLSPYNKKATDKERKEYFVGPIKKAIKEIEKLNLKEKTNKT